MYEYVYICIVFGLYDNKCILDVSEEVITVMSGHIQSMLRETAMVLATVNSHSSVRLVGRSS